MVVVGDGQRDDAAAVAATDVGSWMAKADGGHLVPLLVQLAWKGRSTTRASRRSTSRSPAAGSTPKSSSVSTGLASMRSRVRRSDRAPPSRWCRQTLRGSTRRCSARRRIASSRRCRSRWCSRSLKRTPTRFVLALSERDQRRASRNVQVVFEVAARLAKAGHSVSVYAAESAASPEQLSHLGGPKRSTATTAPRSSRRTSTSTHAVIVPAPGGKSVFGQRHPVLAELGAGLLIAVGRRTTTLTAVTMGTTSRPDGAAPA